MDDLSLTPQELLTPVGQKLKAYFTSRLQALRVQNDSPKLSPEQRAVILAEISITKLALQKFTDVS